jgi:hypothetical protein
MTMMCPGCNKAIGRFEVDADTGEHLGTVLCRVTGLKYVLQQDIPKRLAAAGLKQNKRRKSRRPIVIAARRAERRAAAAAKTKKRRSVDTVRSDRPGQHGDNKPIISADELTTACPR